MLCTRSLSTQPSIKGNVVLLEITITVILCAIFCFGIAREKMNSAREILGAQVLLDNLQYVFKDCIVVNSHTDDGDVKYVCEVRNPRKLFNPSRSFCEKVWKELIDLDINADYFTISINAENIVVFPDGQIKRYRV